MAKVVLVDTGTVRIGVSNVGDVVSVHDDATVLGPAYSTFKIITVNATVEQVQAAINTFLSSYTLTKTPPKSLVRLTNLSENKNLTQFRNALAYNG